MRFSIVLLLVSSLVAVQAQDFSNLFNPNLSDQCVTSATNALQSLDDKCKFASFFNYIAQDGSAPEVDEETEKTTCSKDCENAIKDVEKSVANACGKSTSLILSDQSGFTAEVISSYLRVFRTASCTKNNGTSCVNYFAEAKSEDFVCNYCTKVIYDELKKVKIDPNAILGSSVDVDSGYTEIDFGKCSSESLKQIGVNAASMIAPSISGALGLLSAGFAFLMA